MEVAELAPGLWRWTAPHPEWRPDFGWEADVGCFYVETRDRTLVVDPLVPRDDRERFWSALDRDVERRARPVAVLLTQAAHARDAGEVARRYDAEIWGHEDAREKVGAAPFHAITYGDDVPGGRVLEHAEEPGGSGTPLYLEAHRAVAVGDVFIAVGGSLRVWWSYERNGSERAYRERYLPSLRRWLELPIDHVLVSHGEQVRGGAEQLAAALEQPPYEGL